MAKTHPKQSTSLTEQELQQRWAARCTTGNFSPGVLGVGTIRVMGRAGDAPVAFPRIESLAALGSLEPDEQWAVRAVQAMIVQAPSQSRTVLAVTPAQPGQQAPTPTRVTEFDPSVETLVVTSMIRGG